MYTDLYRPFRAKGSLENEIDNLSHRSFGSFINTGMLEGEWLPPVAVAETESEVIYTAKLPGLKAEEIDISIDDDVLTIHGGKKLDHQSLADNHHELGEQNYGSVKQSVKLPFGAIIKSLNAYFLGGVLTVKIPKQKISIHKKVNLKTAYSSGPTEEEDYTEDVDPDMDDLSQIVWEPKHFNRFWQNC